MVMEFVKCFPLPAILEHSNERSDDGFVDSNGPAGLGVDADIGVQTDYLQGVNSILL